MAKLTKRQIAFLERHGIGIEETFDASGLKRAEYKERMKAEGKSVAYGVTRCNRANHSLRDRGGTCIECFPASIAYRRRHSSAGYAYIAQSVSAGIIKIGFSTDPHDRIYIANLEGYAGAYDWQIRRKIWSVRAGIIENELKSALSAYQVLREWERNWEIITATETFECPLGVATRKLNQIINPSEADTLSKFPLY